MVSMIKTIYCAVHLGISMLIAAPFGILGFFVGLLGLRRLKVIIMRYTAIIWAKSVIFSTGCKITVTGRENIPTEGGVCFVSNHGGIFDIPLLLACSRKPLGFVAKKELAWIPILNIWISMLGGLFIDRKNPRKGLATINKGIERIKAGGAMLIFPEGHRSRGRGLLPFHPGSLKLATHAEAVIVPVAIKGSYEVFEKTGRVHAVPIQVTFCKTINTADIPLAGRKLILSDQIYEVIKGVLERS